MAESEEGGMVTDALDEERFATLRGEGPAMPTKTQSPIAALEHPVRYGHEQLHDSNIPWHKCRTRTCADARRALEQVGALEAENERLRELAIRAELWVNNAPCPLCGYNGQRYYQPDAHECARLASEMGVHPGQPHD